MIHVKDNDCFNEMVEVKKVKHGQILDIVENITN